MKGAPDSEPDDAQAIIPGPGGVWDIGVIDQLAAKALAVSAGPIRLLNGYQGRTGGWGRQHLIQVRERVRAIEALGYPSCDAFVFDVAANWTVAKAAAEAGRLKLVKPTASHELAIVVQWTGRIWSVTTALPYRPDGKAALYVKTV